MNSRSTITTIDKTHVISYNTFDLDYYDNIVTQVMQIKNSE